MNRRELMTAALALALPITSSAGTGGVLLASRRQWHPERPYSPHSPEDDAVLQSAIYAGELHREQWDSLRDWIGVRPQEAVRTLVGHIGEDRGPVPTYMTVADALALGRNPNLWSIGWEPLTVYRLRTWSESHLFLRASVRGFLPPPTCVYVQPGRIEVKPPLQVGEKIVLRIENASIAFDHFYRVDQAGAQREDNQ